MPLFEVAIIKKPTKKEAEEGTGVEELLFGPKAVLAYREMPRSLKRLTEIRTRLRGKNLACWCALDQPCHADVLLEIANGR